MSRLMATGKVRHVLVDGNGKMKSSVVHPNESVARNTPHRRLVWNSGACYPCNLRIMQRGDKEGSHSSAASAYAYARLLPHNYADQGKS